MIKELLKAFICFYRYCISPVLPPSCRFYPSCSEYALDAIEDHGPLKGIWLAVKRVLRCHPYNDGGFDPVPAPVHSKDCCGAKGHKMNPPRAI